jgi:hypothetical protein
MLPKQRKLTQYISKKKNVDPIQKKKEEENFPILKIETLAYYVREWVCGETSSQAHRSILEYQFPTQPREID